MEGKAVQIVDSNDVDNVITVHKDSICRILQHPEIKDHFVSIISITGAYRQGKSLLLNFLLRYLRKRYVRKQISNAWLQVEDGLLTGFSWATGSKRHTTGIHLWSEVFWADLPSGEKIAILLMDTQGSFDHQSCLDNYAKIFAFSTLISSVQILNLMRNISHEDLIYLQLFGPFGNFMSGSYDAPLGRLWFLVRDWPNAFEKPYGLDGGGMLLDEIVKDCSKDVKIQLDIIQQLFTQRSCFLLPYPGDVVASSDNFRGNLNDLDDEFKEHVQEFAVTLLAPENLVPKMINGKKIKASELCTYIEEYGKILEAGDFPQCEDIFKATVEANHKEAGKCALKWYQEIMKTSLENSNMSAWQLRYLHESSKGQAIHKFKSERNLEDQMIMEKYLKKLDNDLETEFQIILRRHHSQKQREKEFTAYKQQPPSSEPERRLCHII